MKSRNAYYTTPTAEEVQLEYTIEAPNSRLHGTPGTAFYSAADYARKQMQHGIEVYPEPLPAK